MFLTRRGALTLALATAIGLGSIVALQLTTGRDEESLDQPLARPETPSPSASRPEIGRDIGVGYPVCRVSTLEGIDLLGTGKSSTAWTATNVTDEGRCNRQIDDSYLVAVDVSGDGIADASWEALDWCVVCSPFAGTDLDADGDEELVVLQQGGSVSSYVIFSVEEGSDGTVGLAPIKVAPPGAPTARLRPGKQLHLWVGGDEGFSARIGCENYPEDPILVLAWSNHPIEGPGSETTEVHVSRLKLVDGAFHVVGTSRTEEPTGYDSPVTSATAHNSCGIDLGDL